MKIAIIKLSAMGDIIHAMVALQFIKQKFPDAKIDWIVEEGFAQILRDNPDINQVLTLNLKSIKNSFFNIFGQIRQVLIYSRNDYDFVIDAQGLAKSAIVAYFLGKNRIGFDSNSTRESIASFFYTKKVSIKYEENVILRNIKVICESLGIFIGRDQLEAKKPFLFFADKNFAQCLSKDKKNILLVLGASKPNKIYPKENFAKIVENLDANFICVWANDFEKEAADYLSQNFQNAITCSKLSLDSLKSLISKVDLVIGGDTGPTHMAWGLNIASICIFGNTPHNRNTFVGPKNLVVKSSSEVNALKLDKKDFSIAQIDPNEIIKLAKKVLDE